MAGILYLLQRQTYTGFKWIGSARSASGLGELHRGLSLFYDGEIFIPSPSWLSYKSLATVRACREANGGVGRGCIPDGRGIRDRREIDVCRCRGYDG
jgi:hypothetical protein